MDASTSESSGIEATGPIEIRVTGGMEIVISDAEVKTVGRCSQAVWSLHYYSGRFRSGTSEAPWIEACILAHDCATAEAIHGQCTRFHHPYVMRSLGYGKGAGAYSKYAFVAFPSFGTTLAEWLLPDSGAATMGRFSEDFIEIVSQTVKGMIALHDNNFDCPDMRGKHVAIMEENERLTVKIWNFHACEPGTKKQGWYSLAQLLRQAANNNQAGAKDSLEIDDLCTRMTKGTLKGLNILKHSALLTVRQKFDNVLALNLHVLLKCEPAPVGSSAGLAQNQPSAKLSRKQPSPAPAEKYSLEEFLDLPGTVLSKASTFIWDKRGHAILGTFRKLLDELRDIIEHEDEYFPPDMTRKFTPNDRGIGKKEIDLEQHIRKSWADGFLKIQKWAVNPSIKLLR